VVPVIKLRYAHLARTVKKFPPDVAADESRRPFFLAVAVLKHYLGTDWVDRNLSPEVRTPGFFRLDFDDKNRAELTAYKALDLAELLLNLQNKKGFESRLARMKTGELEAVCAELDLGRMLHCNLIDFRFVEPQGVKGLDYDIEIALPDGVVVCADAKCKIEATEFSENTVRDSLNKARSQFPSNMPSAIFMKVPPRWLQQDGVRRSTIRIAKEFLRGTRRVVSVKFYSPYLAYRDGIVEHHQQFREISNPSNKFEPARNWDMFGVGTDAGGKIQNWRRILNFPVGFHAGRRSDTPSSGNC
jgi:hypothetical protein